MLLVFYQYSIISSQEGSTISECMYHVFAMKRARYCIACKSSVTYFRYIVQYSTILFDISLATAARCFAACFKVVVIL